MFVSLLFGDTIILSVKTSLLSAIIVVGVNHWQRSIVRLVGSVFTESRIASMRSMLCDISAIEHVTSRLGCLILSYIVYVLSLS